MTKMLYPKFYGNVMFVIITLGLLLTIRTSVCDDGAGRTDKGGVNGNVAVNNATLNIKVTHTDKTPDVIAKSDEKTTNVQSNKKQNLNNGTSSSNNLQEAKKNQSQIVVDTTGIPLVHMPSLNAGAMKRAFYVFVGLSAVVVAYLMFRSTRLGKNPAQMVRKYGVLAHKQDIEMRPLPLDEDDDDDTTVFDASGLSSQRPKHQAS